MYPRTDARITKIYSVLSKKQPDLTIVCENIHDPHNVSAIIRTCDAVGIMNIHLLYTTAEFPDIGKKSSSGLKKWIPTIRHSSEEECIAKLHQAGYQICATTLLGNSIPHFEVDFTRPTALIMGNEHEGISSSLAEKCDLRIHIPMFGMAQSLNVSVATAVLLYEAVRQRMNAALYNTSRLSEQETELIAANWLAK